MRLCGEVYALGSILSLIGVALSDELGVIEAILLVQSSQKTPNGVLVLAAIALHDAE